jgi:hypothetical protein
MKNRVSPPLRVHTFQGEPVKIKSAEKDQLIADLRQQLYDLKNQDRDYRGVNDEIINSENRYKMLSDDKVTSFIVFANPSLNRCATTWRTERGWIGTVTRCQTSEDKSTISSTCSRKSKINFILIKIDSGRNNTTTCRTRWPAPGGPSRKSTTRPVT